MSEQKTKQYGDNFYLLFEAKRVEIIDPELNIVDLYLRRVEREHGVRWENFLKENDALMNEIFAALENLKLFETLCAQRKILMRAGDWAAVEIFEAQNNLDSLGISAWAVLSPLLELAGSLMAKYEINPREFFG